MAIFTQPPAVPQRGDRSTFSGRVDAFLTWMAGLIPQLSAFLAQLTTLAAGGAYSLPYAVDTTTGSDSDPGSGNLRFNLNANQSTSTILRVSTTGSNGAMFSSLLDTFDDSSSIVRGHLRLCKLNDPTAFLVFAIAGISGSGAYRNISGSVVNASSTNPFSSSDSVIVYFQRTGDKGDVGQVLQAKFSERYQTGTGAGTTINNTEYARTLNTTDFNDIPGVSISVNNILINSPGTYIFTARAPTLNAGNHRAYLRNITDGTFIQGGNVIASSTAGIQSDATVTGKFTITGAKTFSLRHFITTAQQTNGFGAPINRAGEIEIYAEVTITKIA